MHRKLLPQWDVSHIFSSLGIWTLTGGTVLWGNWLLPHISKHFHKSWSWHALHSVPLAVIGPRPACTVQLWNTYTEGLPPWFWWMDGHDAIGLHSSSDVWSASYWEADVRQQSCFLFTSRGLSVAGRFQGRLLVVWGIRVTGLRLKSAIMLPC